MSDAIETTLCTNCKHDILSSNFVIHTIHCQRNIYLCPKCNEPVNRGQQAEHDESNHTLVFCKSCHTQLEKWKLNNHLSNDCPKRKIKCKICEIETAVSDISEHENYCGARTEKCIECGEFVMLKYKQLHLESNHSFIKLSDEPGPSPSWQNGRRFLGNFLTDLDSGNLKPQSNQKRKTVQNRIQNSVDDMYNTKKIQNEAAGQYSNEKNNIYQSNQIKKTMPTPPKETTLGAVKKTIPPKYPSPLATSKIFDNTDQDFRAKSNDKAINQVIQKIPINPEIDMLELDRLIALQISEEGEKEEEALKAEEKRLREAEEKRKADEEQDFLLAYKLHHELNNKEDVTNDFLLAQLSDESKDEKTLNTGFFMDSYEKITDDADSFKNIFKDDYETKTTRKPDFTNYKDDLEDEFLLYNKKDIDKNDTQNISLPCEYCDQMIPVEFFSEHEVGFCVKKNNIYKEETFDCELCGESIKISDIEIHGSYCLQARKYKDESRRSWRAEKSSNISSNRKSLNTNHNSPLLNGFDRSPNQSFSLDYLDSPKNNNDRQKNIRRSQSSGESSGAVPRTQARTSASKTNNRSLQKK